MTKEEKINYFKTTMVTFADALFINKKQIKDCLGISEKEVNTVVSKLTYLGNKSHNYLIVEVAEQLVSYMEVTARQKQIIEENKYGYIHSKTNIVPFKTKSEENEFDYWKVS